MTERRLYELVNMSDAITFVATLEEACVIRAILGKAKMFVHDAETGIDPDIEDVNAVRDAIFADRARLDSYADAYLSFLCSSPGSRRDFEEAIKRMSPDDADAYRKDWQDRHRSSMNDIVKNLWERGDALRKWEVKVPA